MLTFLARGSRYHLRSWHEPPAGHDARARAAAVVRELVSNPAIARRACEMLAHAHPRRIDAAILAAIEARSLALDEEPLARLTPVTHEQQDEGSAEEAEQKLEWIEVEIVDPDGNPVPHVLVEIEAPDGSTSKQMANENGFVRVEGIPGGTCTIRLPRWDHEAWRAQ